MKAHRFPVCIVVISMALLTLLNSVGGTSAMAQRIGVTELVSVASDSAQGNERSVGATISSDGRYVVFNSWASNLVGNDTNNVCDTNYDGTYNENCPDVFVRDRQTGQTTRVSVASDGTQGNGWSEIATTSADGRYIAFVSQANNLVSGDTNDRRDLWGRDIFVHDRQTGETSLVSVASDGTQGNGPSYFASISADGRHVAFYSWASNLVVGDTNGREDIFVHDRQTGETSLASVASDGTQGNGPSDFPSISADGRFVAFVSEASNLVIGDTNGREDIFVHDRQTGETSLVSVGSDGTQGNGPSDFPSISADGRFVAFVSEASNLVVGDTNGWEDIFVHDRQTGETSLVSVASDGTQGNGDSVEVSNSADGRYVAFTSYASNFVSNDINRGADVFVHDRQTDQTTCVSLDLGGSPGNSYSFMPSISPDGGYVAFTSNANNLILGDINGVMDVFLHDQRFQLDLPIGYVGEGMAPQEAFSLAFNRCTTSFFDHRYPGEKGVAGDGLLWMFTGDVLPGTLTNCELFQTCYDGHEGYDFEDLARCGNAVYPVATGEIIASETGWRSNDGYGNRVVIRHGTTGYKTLYGHLSQILVSSGPVTRGTQIGIIGNTGCPGCGTHLHFNVYYDETLVDPSSWFGDTMDPWEQSSGVKSRYLWAYPLTRTGTVYGPAGGFVTSASGNIRVNVPPGAYADTLNLTIIDAPVANPSAQLSPTGYSFFLQATDSLGNPVTTFAEPLTTIINFRRQALIGVKADTLSLYNWSSVSNEWQALQTNLDLVAQTATAQVSHLSYFALMGEPSPGIYLPIILKSHS
jgi:murein DD-endopeptidase MepM/ murein hydrolase activator NlpD/cold shock CspA family protein